MITEEQFKKIFTLRDNFILTYKKRELYIYQKAISDKIIRSALLNDGKTIAGEFSRQTGKTTIIADTIVFLLVFYFSLCKKFNITHYPFFNVGFFAPQMQQTKTDWDLIKAFLNQIKDDFSINYTEFNADTINILGKHGPRMVYCFTASPTSNPESKTLNLIIYEEAQSLVDKQIDKAISPMGASCVCKGTKVLNEKGQYVNIEELKVDNKILGTNSSNDIAINDIHGYGRTGVKECYRLKTNSGRILECSFDHPIMIKERKNRKLKWVNTNELKKGVQIAIIDKIDIFGNKTFFDARLIGMLIGDGCYRKRGMVRYCSCDYELLNYVKMKYDFKSYNSYLTKKGKVFEDGTIKGLCSELRNIGIYGQTGKNKRLPNNIDSYKKSEICELLGGFFDTDGCVTVEDNRRGRIYLDSCSNKLLWDVFFQLEKIGIHSRIYHSFTKSKMVFGRNGVWRLVISEKQSILRFHNNIKLLVGYKQAKLNLLYEILKKHKCKRQKNMIEVYFERLVNIETLGMKEVYNLCAEPFHTYLANNIITHNTNATEIFIGVGGYQRCKFWSHIEKLPNENKIIVPYKMALAERERMYKLTGNVLHLNYKKYVLKKMDEIGEESDEFKTQYALEWMLERGQFITYEQIMNLEKEYEVRVEKIKRIVGGIDWGKMHDSTVFTVVDEDGYIVAWYEWQGDDYASQIKDICLLITKEYQYIDVLHCDSSGTQDQIVDVLRAELYGKGLRTRVVGLNFSTYKSDIYKNLARLMLDRRQEGQIIEKAFIKMPKKQSKEKIKFVRQFIDLQKEIKPTGKWDCHHPDGKDFHDDFCDSQALCCWGLKETGLPRYKPSIF